MTPIRSFHPCQSTAGLNEPGAQKVSDFTTKLDSVLSKKLSRVEFEKFIASIPNYKPENGDRDGIPILCTLCLHELNEYVPAVLKIGSKSLINHGDSHGLTAIFYAIIYHQNNIETVKKLIEEGSDLFSLTTFPKQIARHRNNHLFYTTIPAGASILWVACEMRSASDVMVLLKKGALFNCVNGAISPALTGQGKKTLAEAEDRIKEQDEKLRKKIQEQNKKYSKKLQTLHQNQTTYFHLVPSDVLNEVAKSMTVAKCSGFIK